MPDKARWDIDQLEKEISSQDAQLANHEDEIRELQSFRDSTVEKLITIFSTIQDMKENSKWLTRMFASTLIGGIATVISALVIWLIQS